MPKGSHFKTHGMSKGAGRHPLYPIWKAMRQRCSNPNDADYERYGGRGISVDPSWDDFPTFLADVGERPFPNATLDRKDNDGPYSKGNCVWSTQEQQARNKSTTRWIDIDDRRITLIAACEEHSIKYATVLRRINVSGMTPKDALTTPVRPWGR